MPKENSQGEKHWGGEGVTEEEEEEWGEDEEEWGEEEEWFEEEEW